MKSEQVLRPVSEVQPESGIGRDSFYRLIREGKIRVVRIGRKILVPASELEAFVEREAK